MSAADDKALGLYNKFEVRRVDGSSEPGGKHHKCECFVLDLAHDKHASAALRAYAESCRAEFPMLARDILAKVAAMSLLDSCSLGMGCEQAGVCYAEAMKQPDRCGRLR